MVRLDDVEMETTDLNDGTMEERTMRLMRQEQEEQAMSINV
jgi:hypothetical protein